MAASFPGAIKSFTSKSDDTDDVMAADVNALQDEVAAIEAELGTDPAGTVTNLKTRLARSLDCVGNVDFAAISALTISSGSVTVTQNWHSVDTEGAAASDDLATILATNVTDGFLLYLRQANDARDVTLKHGTGNIQCPGGVDMVLADATQVVALIYDAATSKWLASTSSANVGILNKSNTFSAEQIFTKAERHAYTSVSANTTLDTTHYVVDVDASGGAITITLPTAASVNGREYVIRKLDSSGNAVTIDGYSAETINGAATKVLSAQYATARIMSDGTNWIVL